MKRILRAFCSAQTSESGHELVVELEGPAIVYSGFAHRCFWQCSESRFTGNLPVHDAPPIYMKLKLALLLEMKFELRMVLRRR